MAHIYVVVERREDAWRWKLGCWLVTLGLRSCPPYTALRCRLPLRCCRP